MSAFLKNLPVKRDLAAGVYLFEATWGANAIFKVPNLVKYIVYRGAQSSQEGSKNQHDGLYLQSINSIKHQKRRHLGFGVFIVIWSMIYRYLYLIRDFARSAAHFPCFWWLTSPTVPSPYQDFARLPLGIPEPGIYGSCLDLGVWDLVLYVPVPIFTTNILHPLWQNYWGRDNAKI
jgi:hypothetical protein